MFNKITDLFSLENAGEPEFWQLVQEYEVMKGLSEKHPNIINLIGACSNHDGILAPFLLQYF